MFRKRYHTIVWASVMVWAIGIALSGCTFSQVPQSTPTAIPISPTATHTPTPSPVPTVTAMPDTPTPQPVIQPTDTPLPPTNTPLPTATPGPFEHEIQTDETLGYIIQLYGHRSFDVIAEVVRLNDTLLNADSLPPVGTIILIPRPTPTPSNNPTDGQSAGITRQVEQAPIGDRLQLSHVVQDGESIIDIAQQYNTTLEIISQLNPAVGFYGCNFNIPSGGPDCIIILQVGQEIVVPAPTPTPTLSPTPSGNETATPTPTYNAPSMVFPPNNGIAQAGILRLQWVSSGALASDEVYIIYVQDITANTDVSAFITRANAYDLPIELIPRDGETHEFRWWVTVGKTDASGVYRDISGQADVSTFYWQSATS